MKSGPDSAGDSAATDDTATTATGVAAGGASVSVAVSASASASAVMTMTMTPTRPTRPAASLPLDFTLDFAVAAWS